MQIKNQELLIHLAYHNSQLEVFKYLLDKSLEETVDKKGLLPIHNAAQGGNLEIIKMLAKHKGGVNVRTTIGNLLLHFTYHQGYLKVVKYLLYKKLEEGVNNNSWLPIYNIARGGNLEIIKILAKREGGINI